MFKAAKEAILEYGQGFRADIFVILLVFYTIVFYLVGDLLTNYLTIRYDAIFWLSSSMVQSFSAIIAIFVMFYIFMRSSFDNEILQAQKEIAQLIGYGQVYVDVERAERIIQHNLEFSKEGRSDIIATFPREDLAGLIERALLQKRDIDSKDLHVGIKGYIKRYTERYEDMIARKESFRNTIPRIFAKNILIIIMCLIVLPFGGSETVSIETMLFKTIHIPNVSLAAILVGLGSWALIDTTRFTYKIIKKADIEEFTNKAKYSRHIEAIKGFQILCPICKESLEGKEPYDYIYSCPICGESYEKLYKPTQ